MDLLQLSVKFLIKTSGSGIKNDNISKNYTNQLFGNLRKKSALIVFRQYQGTNIADIHLISKFKEMLEPIFCIDINT